MDKPLFVDQEIEQEERARLVHVLNRWLQALLPNIALIARPPGRRSVELQLRQRSRFSGELWSRHGPQPQVAALLETIRWELALPNHHFIPDDPLLLLMNSAYGIDDVHAFEAFETRYAVKFTKEELERMKTEEWTLGQFVEELLQRA